MLFSSKARRAPTKTVSENSPSHSQYANELLEEKRPENLCNQRVRSDTKSGNRAGARKGHINARDRSSGCRVGFALPQSSDPPQSSNLPVYAVPPDIGDDDWGLPSAPAYKPVSDQTKPTSIGANADNESSTMCDDFDEWSDEDDDDVSYQMGKVGVGAVSRSRSGGPETLTAKQSALKMRNINRFSNFVKSGMESYVLGTTNMTTSADENHEIILSGSGVEWKMITQHYNCIVDKPKKESKLKGLKSFIAYSVTSTLGGIQVSRRYKHFDWLHEQLSAKYILIPIPPLPEKQVAGRYEEDLIEHRKNILQIWVNKLCRHPVLSKSDVWIHFLTCTDEKQWKTGKRKAEKDEYVGGNFLHCVTVPTQPLESNKVEQQIESFSRCLRSLDDNIRNVYEKVYERHKRLVGPYKSNWQKLAAAFAGLGHSFELDALPQNVKVTAALKETAHVFHKIGDDYEESAKKDLEPLMDSLYCYKGLFSATPDILNIYKSAMSKLHENERLCLEGKVDATEADTVRQRVDSVSYAMLAEIDYQHRERGEDFKGMMSTYLTRQATFYEQMSNQLTALASLFRDT